MGGGAALVDGERPEGREGEFALCSSKAKGLEAINVILLDTQVDMEDSVRDDEPIHEAAASTSHPQAAAAGDDVFAGSVDDVLVDDIPEGDFEQAPDEIEPEAAAS